MRTTRHGLRHRKSGGDPCDSYTTCKQRKSIERRHSLKSKLGADSDSETQIDLRSSLPVDSHKKKLKKKKSKVKKPKLSRSMSTQPKRSSCDLDHDSISEQFSNKLSLVEESESTSEVSSFSINSMTSYTTGSTTTLAEGDSFDCDTPTNMSPIGSSSLGRPLRLARRRSSSEGTLTTEL